jgi:hypothetical protein
MKWSTIQETLEGGNRHRLKRLETFSSKKDAIAYCKEQMKDKDSVSQTELKNQFLHWVIWGGTSKDYKMIGIFPEKNWTSPLFIACQQKYVEENFTDPDENENANINTITFYENQEAFQILQKIMEYAFQEHEFANNTEYEIVHTQCVSLEFIVTLQDMEYLYNTTSGYQTDIYFGVVDKQKLDIWENFQNRIHNEEDGSDEDEDEGEDEVNLAEEVQDYFEEDFDPEYIVSLA